MRPEPLNAEGLAYARDYAGTMRTVILPFLEAHCRKSTVRGQGDKPLACRQYYTEQAKGTVLIVHGFTENAYKFSELIYSLLMNGYDVCAWDQRGHGDSWRKKGIEDPSLTHVDDFEAYVGDMERVCADLLADMPGPRFLFAHSMGGAVSGLYLERHDGEFCRAVLCAPMIAPNLGLPAPLVKAMCRAAVLAGKGEKRVFASKPYAGPEDFDTSCATGRARFDWYDAVKAKTRAYQNNGPTYGWTLQAASVTKKLLAKGAPEGISIPVRLYTAEDDGSVLPGPQEAFIRRVPRGVRALVPGSRHEIYRSDDDVLFPWWREILAFYGEADESSTL